MKTLRGCLDSFWAQGWLLLTCLEMNSLKNILGECGQLSFSVSQDCQSSWG